MEKLTPQQIEKIKNAIPGTAAIMRLEGFEKTPFSYAADEAVLAGRITRDQIVRELCAYVAEHKTLDGFDESREWLKKDFFDVGEIILNENTEELTQNAINRLEDSPQPPYGTPEWDRWKMARLARMASDPVYLERQMAFIRGARGYGRKHSI